MTAAAHDPKIASLEEARQRRDDEYERLVREPLRRHYQEKEADAITRLEREVERRKAAIGIDAGYAAEQPRQRMATSATEEPPPPLPYIDMADWDRQPVPELEWAVFNRIPRRQCVLFSGEGAAGKST